MSELAHATPRRGASGCAPEQSPLNKAASLGTICELSVACISDHTVASISDVNVLTKGFSGRCQAALRRVAGSRKSERRQGDMPEVIRQTSIDHQVQRRHTLPSPSRSKRTENLVVREAKLLEALSSIGRTASRSPRAIQPEASKVARKSSSERQVQRGSSAPYAVSRRRSASPKRAASPWQNDKSVVIQPGTSGYKQRQCDQNTVIDWTSIRQSLPSKNRCAAFQQGVCGPMAGDSPTKQRNQPSGTTSIFLPPPARSAKQSKPASGALSMKAFRQLSLATPQAPSAEHLPWEIRTRHSTSFSVGKSAPGNRGCSRELEKVTPGDEPIIGAIAAAFKVMMESQTTKVSPRPDDCQSTTTVASDETCKEADDTKSSSGVFSTPPPSSKRQLRSTPSSEQSPSGVVSTPSTCMSYVLESQANVQRVPGSPGSPQKVLMVSF